MRFVSPETVRIELKDGDWIEIKKELTVADDHGFRIAGMTATVNQTTGRPDIGVDLTAVSRARVMTYLVDWSAKHPDGKDVALTESAVMSLATEDYEAIDRAIQDHIEAMRLEKKTASTSFEKAS